MKFSHAHICRLHMYLTKDAVSTYIVTSYSVTFCFIAAGESLDFDDLLGPAPSTPIRSSSSSSNSYTAPARYV
jgi:hypothetical protein